MARNTSPLATAGRLLRRVECVRQLVEQTNCKPLALARPAVPESGGLGFESSEKTTGQSLALGGEFHKGYPPILCVPMSSQKASRGGPVEQTADVGTIATQGLCDVADRGWPHSGT